MWKLVKTLLTVFLVVSICNSIGILSDKAALQDNLIRLHVVANSDCQEDQAIKLQVKDAVVSYLQPLMEQFSDQIQAKEQLQNSLEDIQNIADSVLQKLGTSYHAKVSLQKESFDTKEYETFSLPAGVYESLRVEIGDGEGKNWWCVVFPTLCVPASVSEFQDMAVSAGFNEDAVNTLTGEAGYEIRFYLLECLGRVENFFFGE